MDIWYNKGVAGEFSKGSWVPAWRVVGSPPPPPFVCVIVLGYDR